MGKLKSQGKDKKKGSQFVIRVDKAERDAFVALCDRLDTSAAREIRRFMRERVAAHSGDTPALSDAAASGLIANTDDTTAARIDGAPPEAAMEADMSANVTGKPKKKRAPQQSV